MKLSLVCDFV